MMCQVQNNMQFVNWKELNGFKIENLEQRFQVKIHNKSLFRNK